MRGPPSAFFQWAILALYMQCAWAGHDIIEVKSGICPQYRYGCFGHSEIICHDDSNCRGSQKCCPYRCKVSCVDAVLEKIGRCPSDVSLCGKPDPNECEEDFDCRGMEKCCRTKCGAKCKLPPETKSGNCPAKTSMCSPSEDIKPPKCKSDGDCPGDKKCCIVRCRQECVEPTLPGTVYCKADKAGKCPPHNSTEPCKKSLGKDKCYSDGNCPESQKCCGSCLKECSDPARKRNIKQDGKFEILDPDAVAEPKFW